MSRTINMIWSQTYNGIIGRNGAIPWHVPEDLKHFRRATHGHTVIMGRRMWESLSPESQADGRRNYIVLSRQKGYEAEGAQVANSAERALGMVPAKESEVWVIGGRLTFDSMMDRADFLYITDLDFYEGGDTDAPWLNEDWSLDVTDPEGDGLKYSVMGVGYRFRRMKRAREAAESWLEDSPLWS